jgi:hypothetical protein
MPTRRTFLKALAIGASGLLLPKKSRALAFGAFPSRSVPGLPEDRHVTNVLEIYLYGGLSPWESFYFVPERGKRDKRFYYAFEGSENQAALEACGISQMHTQAFAKDSKGAAVHLGPFARALFARPDLIDRTRVVVQKHNLLPHEAAVPYGISGKFVGSPGLSCLGAHVQQAFLEQAKREMPYSYVLMNQGAVPSDNTDAFVATGTHPGTARPLRLNIDDATRIQTLLGRPAVDKERRAAYDAYVASRVQGFHERLRHGGKGEPLRSKVLRELAASTSAVAHSEGVAKLLPAALLEAPTTKQCGDEQLNYPLSSLRLATHLLKHPTAPARYVCVLDSGFRPASGGGGYDTHAGGEQIVQLTNLENLLTSLGSMVNKPGEHDPHKLDLDHTLIILNTEFGRTPNLQDEAGGRNHHPNGYVTVFIGGPTRGRSVYGAIDGEGEAITFATPAENRIAALLALGVFPFAADGFSLSDVAGAKSESEAVQGALARVLGVQS